jgi:uncharacterized protein (TIGR03086 family)
MSGDVRQQIDLALTMLTPLVRGVGADGWDRPTPCGEWDVRMLVNHLVGGARIFAAQLDAAGPVADHDADWLGDDPVCAWESAAEADRAAWRRPDALSRPIELGIGVLPGELAAWVHLTELVAHGADLAVATGQEALLDQGLAAGLFEAMHVMGFEAFRAPELFEPAIAAEPNASAHRQLLAYLGREVGARGDVTA